MREMPTKLQAARPEWVRPEHLPTLPPWWPRDPAPTEEEPHPPPLSAESREWARHQLQMAEARRGPHDGTAGVVVVPAAGPPELLRFGDAKGWAYRLDQADSTAQLLVYRYSPGDSPAHLSTMLVVEEAYLEVGGPGYIDQARADGPESQGITMERINP